MSIPEERLYRLDRQRVDISGYDCSGRVLDIGGGGEGIIGQLLGDRVVAIDPNLNELREAPEGPLKIVMDARDLKFLDCTFDAVTSFFTLMYIKCQDHAKVMQEAYRVLKPGGEFMIWDVNITKYDGGIQDIFVIPLDVDFGWGTDSTGYGTHWAGRVQDSRYFINLAVQAGFMVSETRDEGNIFSIRLVK